MLGVIMGSCEHRSEVCVKCLQHAYVNQKSLYGVLPVYFKRTLSQNHGGIMSSSAFTPGGVPDVKPSLYQDIFKVPCDHAFKKGGYGNTSCRMHSDGSYAEIMIFKPRIDAIKSMYVAYVRYGDVNLAKRTYKAIDVIFPVDINWSNVNISRCHSLCRVSFHPLCKQLNQVTTADQWKDITIKFETLSSLFAEVVAAKSSNVYTRGMKKIEDFNVKITKARDSVPVKPQVDYIK